MAQFLTHFINKFSSSSASLVAEELFTISYADLISAGFSVGDNLVILVNGGLATDLNTAYVRASMRYGTTFAGATLDTTSYHSQEVPSSNSGYHVSYNYMNKRVMAVNENLYFSAWSGTSGRINSYEITMMVIRLNDLGVDEWRYATATHTGNAPTVYGTLGASVTLPQVGDWWVTGTGYWLDDSITATMFQALSIGGITTGEAKVTGQDLENSLSFSTSHAGNLANATVCQVQYKSGTTLTHDCTDTKIFALRLDTFEWHAVLNSTTLTTFSTANTDYQIYQSSPFSLSYNHKLFLSTYIRVTATEAATKTLQPRFEIFNDWWGYTYGTSYGSRVNSNGATDLFPAQIVDYILTGDVNNVANYTLTLFANSGTDVIPSYSSNYFNVAMFSFAFPPAPISINMVGISATEIGAVVAGDKFNIPGIESLACGSLLLQYPIIITVAAGTGISSLQMGNPYTLSRESGLLWGGRIQANEVSPKLDFPGTGSFLPRSEIGTPRLTATTIPRIGLDTIPPITNAGIDPIVSRWGDTVAVWETHIGFKSFGFLNSKVVAENRYKMQFRFNNPVKTDIFGEFNQEYEIQTSIPIVVSEFDMEWLLSTIQLNTSEHNIEYQLDTYLLNETSLSSEWAQALKFVLSELDQDYAIQEVPNIALGMEWSSFGATVSSFDLEWQFTSSRWITDILALVNAERLAAGRTHMLTAYTDHSYGTDIASKHTLDERNTGIYAHESILFPNGWQTIANRLLYVTGANFGMENLALGIGGTEADLNINTGTITPAFIHQTWHDSPVHYANYMYEYPVGAVPKMLVDGQFFGTIVSPPGYEAYQFVGWFTQIFVNLGRPENLVLHQTQLNIEHTFYGAFVEVYNMEYSITVFKHLSIRHEQQYAIKITIDNNQPSGVLVAVQNDQPIYYSLMALNEQGYTQLVSVLADHEQDYPLLAGQPVVGENEQGFSLHLSAINEQGYEGFALVVSSNEQGYTSLLQLSAMNQQDYESLLVFGESNQGYDLTDVLPIAARSDQSYSLMLSILAGLTQSYGNQSFVVADNDQRFDISLTNSVVMQHTSFYSLLGDSYLSEPNDTITVLVGVHEIEVEALSISMDEGDFVWGSEIILSDPDNAPLFTKLSEFSIVINRGLGSEELWNFVVDTKTITRGDFGSVSVNIQGFSLAIVMGDHYSDKKDYLEATDMYASDLAAKIVGSVTWNTMNWLIPAYRFGVKASTPMKALNPIVEAIGGIVESTPAGVLNVRPLFPIHIKDYYTATVDHTFSDLEDNLSCTNDGSISEEQNKFRIMESNSSFSDTVEFEASVIETRSGLLRVHPKPWRESVTVKHTDGLDIVLTRVGVESRELTEQVEIISGEGSLKYPATSLVSVEWLSTGLGTLSVVPRTNNLIASDKVTNMGYGVVKVVYRTESITYQVSNTKDIGQFLVIEEEV